MFEEARKQCDWLVVGVSTTTWDLVDRKKNKPVQNLEERTGQVKAVRYVDEIVVYDSEEALYKLLQELNPEIRFIGADWKGKEYTGHDLDNKTVFTARDHSYSSSELRQRIVRASSLA